jgi:hypothetical protein
MYIYRNWISKILLTKVDRATLEAKLIDRIINQSSDLIFTGKWDRSSDFIVDRAIQGRSRSSNRIVDRAT